MSKKEVIVFILGMVVILSAVFVPVVIISDNNQKNQEDQLYRDLELSFYSQYKSDDTAEYIGAMPVEHMHKVIWRNQMEDPNATVEEGEKAPMITVEHVTLFIDGISLGDIRAYPVD